MINTKNMNKMKKLSTVFFKRALPFVVLSVMLTACPYESKVPISTNGVEIPDGMQGSWVEKSEEKSLYPDYFVFSKGPANTFFIKYYDIKVDSNDVIHDTSYSYRYGHLSKVGDNLFMNLSKEYKSPIAVFDSKYYLYRVKPTDDGGYFMYGLTPYINRQFPSSEELAAYIEKYIDLPFFYETTNIMEFYKKEKW